DPCLARPGGSAWGDLVEKSRLETLARDVRPEDDDIAAAGRFSSDRHRFLDANVEEPAADSPHKRRRDGWVVPQDEERPGVGAAVEPPFHPILDILRATTDQ